MRQYPAAGPRRFLSAAVGAGRVPRRAARAAGGDPNVRTVLPAIVKRCSAAAAAGHAKDNRASKRRVPGAPRAVLAVPPLAAPRAIDSKPAAGR